MNNRAISYVRFSSNPQGNGDSVRRQLKAARDYCAANALVLDETEKFTFHDLGLSGYTGEHVGPKGALSRFISLVENGEVEAGTTLVVESLDRLSRQNATIALPMLLDLVNRGIRVVSLTGPYVFEKSAEDMTLMMALLEIIRANKESELKAERVQKGKARKLAEARAHGTAIGNVHPAWLRVVDHVDGKRYAFHPERVAVVRRIFELALKGLGRTRICKSLNEAGFLPFRAKPGENKGWGTSSVEKILRNKAAFGLYQPMTRDGQIANRLRALDPLPAYFPAAISEEEFYEAQALIADRLKHKVTNEGERYNIWQKVGRCVLCGGPVHYENKGKLPKGGEYLRCYEARNGRCTAKGLRLAETERIFRGMLLRLGSLSLLRDESEAIEREIRIAMAKEQELRAAADENFASLKAFPSDRLRKLISEQEVELGVLERQVSELRGELSLEQSIDPFDAIEQTDLISPTGRRRAGKLMQRQGVLVYMGKAGYIVTQRGNIEFGMQYSEGEACYFMSHWPVKPKGSELHLWALENLRRMSGLIPATRTGIHDHAEAWDSSETHAASLPDDGHPLSDAVAAVLMAGLAETELLPHGTPKT